MLRVCFGDSCTLWASHSTPSAIPSLKDINNKGTQSTHDCKHYDIINSAGIESTQVQIHTLWVVLFPGHSHVTRRKHGSGLGMRLHYGCIWTYTNCTQRFFPLFQEGKCCSLPFERRDPLYLAVSVTDRLHTSVKSTLHLRQWQSILKHNH